MRKRVIYKGHVQGVGFRYTALKISQSYRVCGYVRNLPNGTVELVAEGETAEVRKFLSEIRQRRSMHIHDLDEVTEPETGTYTDFAVRH